MDSKWTRWQDWTVLVVGVVAALAAIWTGVTGAGMAAMVVLGALLAVTAIWSLASPGAMASEWVHAVLGVALIASPWVFSYADVRAAAWTSWLAGIVAVGAALSAVPVSRRVHDRLVHH